MMYVPIVPNAVYGEIARLVVLHGARRVTKFLSDNETVKMTRKIFGKKKRYGSGKRIDIALTIGIPNFAERKFIAKAKKAGEPFPIKKVLIEWPKVKGQ